MSAAIVLSNVNICCSVCQLLVDGSEISKRSAAGRITRTRARFSIDALCKITEMLTSEKVCWATVVVTGSRNEPH
jgi:hypothetical protein